ncbi:Uncharacterized protein APZ42_011749 [Daphnia magna]|uniref:Uncharacterized protein n=1 Tax=Daphnia magna TaxID=35525 RepID=A0A0P5CZE1_9CRUS|nr:Uncharacterized protein APZ42_011749 [Daphnia magna]
MTSFIVCYSGFFKFPFCRLKLKTRVCCCIKQIVVRVPLCVISSLVRKWGPSNAEGCRGNGTDMSSR